MAVHWNRFVILGRFAEKILQIFLYRFCTLDPESPVNSAKTIRVSLPEYLAGSETKIIEIIWDSIYI